MVEASNVIGYCDAREISRSCRPGMRKLQAFEGFRFCDKCWRYRVRLSRDLLTVTTPPRARRGK